MRQSDGKRRSAARRRGNFDDTVMGFDDFLRDRKSKSGSACLVRGKGREKRLKRVLRHAAAVVRNADDQLIQIFAGRQRYAPVFTGRFKGIFEHIQKCLF